MTEIEITQVGNNPQAQQILQQPAIFVNKIHVVTQGTLARFTFGENIGAAVEYYVAVTMSVSDMEDLRNLCSAILQSITDKQTAVAAAKNKLI